MKKKTLRVMMITAALMFLTASCSPDQQNQDQSFKELVDSALALTQTAIPTSTPFDPEATLAAAATATSEAMPTPEEANLPKPEVEPEPTATGYPEYPDLPWWAEVYASWNQDRKLFIPNSVSEYGSDDGINAMDMYVNLHKYLYPSWVHDNNTQAIGVFSNLDPAEFDEASSPSLEDIARVEDLERKGLVKPCLAETATRKPKLCYDQEDMWRIAEILLVAGKWAIKEAIRGEFICHNVPWDSTFAGVIKTFLEMGFRDPGTSSRHHCQPRDHTTKLQVPILFTD